jgi:hypothetical protein
LELRVTLPPYAEFAGCAVIVVRYNPHAPLALRFMGFTQHDVLLVELSERLARLGRGELPEAGLEVRYMGYSEARLEVLAAAQLEAYVAAQLEAPQPQAVTVTADAEQPAARLLPQATPVRHRTMAVGTTLRANCSCAEQLSAMRQGTTRLLAQGPAPCELHRGEAEVSVCGCLSQHPALCHWGSHSAALPRSASGELRPPDWTWTVPCSSGGRVGRALLVLEADKGQHRLYNASCEVARLHQLAEFAGCAVIVVRYNLHAPLEITADDAAMFKHVYPLFEPCFVSYHADPSRHEDLAAVGERVLAAATGPQPPLLATA